MPKASLSLPQSRFGAVVHGVPMRYAFACRKLSGTCHSRYTRAVSDPAAAPTWPPGNMLPLIGAPLVHFGHVPAGLLVVWLANQTVWKLPSNRVSTTSPPGPQGIAPQRVCWKSEIANGGGRRRREERPASSTRVTPAAQPPAPPSYWLRKTTWL